MKSPLRYQFSEYDCGPTTMLNAVSYLFEREEIPPEIIRNVMLYSLDCYSKKGEPGRAGTSRMAMMFLSNWLNGICRSRASTSRASPSTSGRRVSSTMPCIEAASPSCACSTMSSTTPY